MDPADAAALAEQAVSQRHGPWSHSDMLLAAVLDRLGWVIYAAYHAQGGKPAKPEPLPRPGVSPAGGRPVDPRAVALLEERRERNRQARIAAGTESGDTAGPIQLDRKTAALLAARKAARDAQRQQRG